MKHRKKWKVLAAVILAAAVFAGLYWWYTTTPEYQIRKLAAELRRLEKEPGTVKQWLIDQGVMKEKGPEDVNDIVRNIIAFGEAAVPALIRALKDEDSGVRYFAASILGVIGPAAKEAVPALIEALEDECSGVRRSSAIALRRISPAVAVKEAVPVLIKDLEDKDEIVRSMTAITLVNISPASAVEKTVPILIQNVKDKHGRTSFFFFQAARALGKIGPAAKEAVPVLIQALKDEDYNVRRYAAWALGKIGPAAKAAVPALTEALKDEDEVEDVRKAAAEALKRIGKEAEQKTLHHSGNKDSVRPF